MKFPAILTNRLCTLCQQHEAKFTSRGRVKRDRQHDVCHRYYESLTDKTVARQLSETSPSRIARLETSSYFYRQLLEQPWVSTRETQ